MTESPCLQEEEQEEGENKIRHVRQHNWDASNGVFCTQRVRCLKSVASQRYLSPSRQDSEVVSNGFYRAVKRSEDLFFNKTEDWVSLL